MSLFSNNLVNFNSDDVISEVIEYQKYIDNASYHVVTWLFNLKTKSVSVGNDVKYPTDPSVDYLTDTIYIREDGENVDIHTLQMEIERIFSIDLDLVDQWEYLEKVRDKYGYVVLKNDDVITEREAIFAANKEGIKSKVMAYAKSYPHSPHDCAQGFYAGNNSIIAVAKNGQQIGSAYTWKLLLSATKDQIVIEVYLGEAYLTTLFYYIEAPTVITAQYVAVNTMGTVFIVVDNGKGKGDMILARSFSLEACIYDLRINTADLVTSLKRNGFTVNKLTA